MIPIFGDDRLQVSQLDLSRAIETALNAGAHIINISAGQLTDTGEAEDWLERSISLCEKHNVLLFTHQNPTKLTNMSNHNHHFWC